MHDGNVFYKENNNKNGGCAVYILIDLSGSTLGTKYELEMATAICIEGALMNIPDVEVKTVGFSHFYNDSMGGYRASRGFSSRYIRDETGYSCMRVFKDFKEKRSKTPYAYKNSWVRYYYEVIPLKINGSFFGNLQKDFPIETIEIYENKSPDDLFVYLTEKIKNKNIYRWGIVIILLIVFCGIFCYKENRWLNKN